VTRAIADTDILSAFGKVEKVEILDSLFDEIFIAPAVFEELLQAQRAGFTFVEDAIKAAKLIPLDSELEERMRRFSLLYPQLGRGETESIALAVSEKLVVLTNDKQAKRICEVNSVFFMDLEEILRALKVKGILNREGLKQLMEAMEREDRTIIKAKDRILRE
jgi:predicted nucleic acid-binding protein